MVLLAVVFLAVVVPQALSARSERQQEFLASIRFHAGAVEHRDDAPPPAPTRRPQSTVARRKSLLVFLLVAMAVSAIPAVLTPGKMTLIAQLAVDNCFLAYIGMLVRWRDARSPARVTAPVPELVLTPATVHPVLRAS